jgi:hypothetical protein
MWSRQMGRAATQAELPDYEAWLLEAKREVSLFFLG